MRTFTLFIFLGLFSFMAPERAEGGIFLPRGQGLFPRIGRVPRGGACGPRMCAPPGRGGCGSRMCGPQGNGGCPSGGCGNPQQGFTQPGFHGGDQNPGGMAQQGREIQEPDIGADQRSEQSERSPGGRPIEDTDGDDEVPAPFLGEAPPAESEDEVPAPPLDENPSEATPAEEPLKRRAASLQPRLTDIITAMDRVVNTAMKNKLFPVHEVFSQGTPYSSPTMSAPTTGFDFKEGEVLSPKVIVMPLFEGLFESKPMSAQDDPVIRDILRKIPTLPSVTAQPKR